jgi:light-regulated signal transduction histidine kinase (bacteriophytochrome)
VDRQELVIEQAAGDTWSLFGIDPQCVLALSVPILLDTEAAAFVAEQLGGSARLVAPMTRLGIRAYNGSVLLDLTLHAVDGTAILEFEPARRMMGHPGDPIAQLKTLLAGVQITASVDESCAAAATALRNATGFDRAMVYRFLPDGSGVVVAESARPELESLLGLHYPASDVPQQTRELYRRNPLRTIADVDHVPAPLLPPTNPRTRQPIDMSLCALRSVSPIHVDYLRNMGVSASLSASIICRDRLWGMLVLHHYTPRQVAADLRMACETFAQIFSLQTEAKMQAEELEQRIAQRTGQLRALVSDLEAVEQRERQQIARDLHDDLGQTLAAARIRLAGICSDSRSDLRAMANQVGALIDRASESTRSLAAQLAPAVLHKLGLSPALESLGEEIERTFGLKVNLIDDARPKPLSQAMRSILYRGVRELLINVARHAQTDSATVESEAREGRIVVRVSDGGVGYDSTAVAARPLRGLGLVAVRERLSLVGGTVEVHTVPGSGTVTVLTAPLAMDALPAPGRGT